MNICPNGVLSLENWFLNRTASKNDSYSSGVWMIYVILITTVQITSENWTSLVLNGIPAGAGHPNTRPFLDAIML